MTAEDEQWLAERFAENRAHLRAVAYRMLGSVTEADDALQEFWIRLSRSDTSRVQNLRAWLTTGVSRVCLDMLRSRKSRREKPLGPSELSRPAGPDNDPEYEALLADGAGVALLVVLDVLTPPERLAFVLHDVFDVPFDEIAPIVGRTPDAARQLASRARRRVRGASVPDTDLERRWEMVDAFLAAARHGDFDGLLAMLDPDVLLSIDRGTTQQEVRGALAVAKRGVAFSPLARWAQPTWVQDGPGFVVARNGRRLGAAGLTADGGKIVRIDLHIGAAGR